MFHVKQRQTEYITAIIGWAMIAIIGGIVGSIIIHVIVYGVSNHEQLECLKWREEARTYQNYFVTDWQKAQCDHYGIQI